MTWALQDAKNRFSAVAETAAKGQPQVVTRHGRPIVVIISYETYCENISPASQKNIAEAFMDCPASIDFGSLIPPRRVRKGRGHPIRLFPEDAT